MDLAVRGALVAAFAMLATPAHAEERVKVRIGMSMSQIEPYLKSECSFLDIGGDEGGEQYITCELPQGRLITANLSPKDRITYSVYREANDTLWPEEFGAAVAAELGFAGAGEPCMVYSDASLCWNNGSTRLWVYLNRDSSGRLSSFQSDEEMAAEDEM